MRFVDEAVINVRSGKGGRGCVSFRREKFIPRGGPDGGDGGKGGDVWLVASPRLLTLYDFRHKRLHEAQNGQGGMGSQMFGRAGADALVEVPVGTMVYEVLEDGQERLLADLSVAGERLRVAKGGRGGKGNLHFKSATMRTPRFAQPGEPCEEKRLRLVLKIMADVGLIGLPNAGKSTLIAAISAAKPKIAAYPFTTLTPNLGVIQNDVGRQMVIADIPGLVEGAHEGLGLGHRFLKHVERTRVLVHLLSTEEMSGDDPFAGFDLINAELAAFDDRLADKAQIEVVNKIDLWSPQRLAEVHALARDQGRRIFWISAQEGDGLEALVDELWRHVPEPAAEVEATPAQELDVLILDQPDTPHHHEE